MNILVLLAHPDLQQSRANRAMADAARELDHVTVHDLYATAVDGSFDVAVEQAQAEHHDAIVLQHPMHWYHAPPLLQAWLDQVLLMDWAYGGAAALNGKLLRSAVTTGAPASAYEPGGWNPYPVSDYLKVFESTGRFCRMSWGEPFLAYDIFGKNDDEVAADAVRYRTWLQDLS